MLIIVLSMLDFFYYLNGDCSKHVAILRQQNSGCGAGGSQHVCLRRFLAGDSGVKI